MAATSSNSSAPTTAASSTTTAAAHTASPAAKSARTTSSGPAPAFAFSMRDTKFVYLIRHGQGVHNSRARDIGRSAYSDESLLDAPLDEIGRKQASALGEHLRDSGLPIELVVVSPLRRTLETAKLAFGGTVPQLALEEIREAFGAHACDKRGPVSAVRHVFPHVDFSLVKTDEDTWHGPSRETVREVAARGHKFVEFLRERPETHIAVVSHGVFLETLVGGLVLGVVDPRINAERFKNCEIRAVTIGGWAKPAADHHLSD
jgi:broad specificity phosphatase PhoE